MLRISSRKLFTGLAAFCLLCGGVQQMTAQTTAQHVLSNIKGLNKEKISYDYSMELRDVLNNKVIDQMYGKIYMNKLSFLDSNARYINIKDASYSLQISMEDKMGYVKSIRDIEQKVKRDVDGAHHVLFDLNALLRDRVKTAKVDKDANGNFIVHLGFNGSDIKSLTAVLDGAHNISKLVLRFATEVDGAGAYERALTMYHFSDGFDNGITNTARLLKVHKDKYTLKDRYAGFTVRQLSFSK